MRTQITAIALASVVAAVSGQPAAGRTRVPLSKQAIALESPSQYAFREKVDRASGKLTRFDHKPTVESLDPKLGTYALTWIGLDGRERRVVYQRPDAIDLVVEATVNRPTPGRYRYSYRVHNLPSGGQRLSGFAVQTFSNDVEPRFQPHVYIGSVTKYLGSGVWIRFAPLDSFIPPVVPGSIATFQLESSTPPGLVDCTASGGALGIDGVDEEMPSELEAVLPGYEAWPRGRTVGPDERLQNLSSAERSRQLVAWFPEFERLGWMTVDARHEYSGLLERDAVAILVGLAERDLASSRITTEVFAVIKGLESR